MNYFTDCSQNPAKINPFPVSWRIGLGENEKQFKKVCHNQFYSRIASSKPDFLHDNMERYMDYFERLQKYSLDDRSLPHQNWHKELIGLLFNMGIIRFPVQMDYKVNRSTGGEAECLGISSFPSLESSLLSFYRKNGAHFRPGDKLVSLSLGPGNGSGIHERLYQKANGDNGAISERFAYFGYANNIYSCLEDLIYSFIKKKEGDAPLYLEFSHVLATLILRYCRIAEFSQQFGRIFNNSLHAQELLMNIKNDANLIRDVLFHLDECRIVTQNDAIMGKSGYLADLQYASERVIPVSAECQSLFGELASCFFDLHGNRPTNCHERIESFIYAHFEPQFLNMDCNINEAHISFPQNIILGDFEELPVLLNNCKMHLITACFSTSHLSRDAYLRNLQFLLSSLDEGGVILDNGDVESYSRIDVFHDIMTLVKQFPDINIDVITSDCGVKLSLLLQKGFVASDNKAVFFSNEEKLFFLAQNCKITPGTNYPPYSTLGGLHGRLVNDLMNTEVGSLRIRDHHLLRFNFFRTLNTPIEHCIMDAVLDITFTYAFYYLYFKQEFDKSSLLVKNSFMDQCSLAQNDVFCNSLEDLRLEEKRHFFSLAVKWLRKMDFPISESDILFMIDGEVYRGLLGRIENRMEFIRRKEFVASFIVSNPNYFPAIL